MFNNIINLFIAIITFIIMTFIISKASDKLGEILHILGIKIKIPSSVRGATLDAISSSFPEFSTAMISVLVYKQFTDIGIPTIAGSGIFNVLIIPMFSIFAYKGKNLLIKIDKKTIFRDMSFYLFSLITLIIFTYKGKYTMLCGLILVFIYITYIFILHMETKKYRNKLLHKQKYNKINEEIVSDIELKNNNDMNYKKIIFWIIITITIIWLSVDQIVKAATIVSTTLRIPKYIVSVIIIAACTSIPDTILSIKSAKNGDIEGSISNAIGSNVFDICICLGLPIILSGKSLSANLNQNLGIICFLIISMFTTVFVLLKEKGVSKKDALAMQLVYIIFVFYVISVALDWNLYSTLF